MTTTTSCPIKLFNRIYDIKCPESEVNNLQLAAEKLNEQLYFHQKKFRQLDDFQHLLLAALHISHELITCQKRQEQQREQVTQFISTLENKINQTVNGGLQMDHPTD